MYPVAQIKSTVETQGQIPLPIIMSIAAHCTQIVLKSDRIKSVVRGVEQTQGKRFKATDFIAKSS